MISCKLSRIAQRASRCQYRAHNLVVARAAAKIARERETNFLLRWIRIVLKQRLCRYNEARSAEAALQGSMLDKCFLHRMEFSFPANPFDCCDFGSICFDSENETRVNRCAVKFHCAASAVAVAAALLGAGKTNSVP